MLLRMPEAVATAMIKSIKYNIAHLLYGAGGRNVSVMITPLFIFFKWSGSVGALMFW